MSVTLTAAWRRRAVVILVSAALCGCVWTDAEGSRHAIFLPLLYSEVNADGSMGCCVVPPMLSAVWTDQGGNRHSWLTPLHHMTRGPDGRPLHMHALNYAQWGEHEALVPFYFNGPGYTILPLLFSGRWTGADESETVLIGPLLSWSKRRRPGFPTEVYVLGGIIFKRRLDYERRTYRYFILGLPVGQEKSF